MTVNTVNHCPTCGHRGPETVAKLNVESRRRLLNYSNLKYDGLLDDWISRIPPIVLWCPDCGHYWYRYQPDKKELAAMYAAARPLDRNSAPPTRAPTKRMLTEMLRLKSLLRSSVAPTLLDYGSGFGRWARAATQVGFVVTAFEPSITRSAEEEPPFELVHDLHTLKDRKFDAIQLEQVLEHIPDPLQTLRTIRDFCYPWTIIRLTVPNVLRCSEGRAIWRVWPFDGKSPHILAPFEHLHGFTPKSLRMLLKRSGFESISITLLIRYYPFVAISESAGRLIMKAGTSKALVCMSSKLICESTTKS